MCRGKKTSKKVLTGFCGNIPCDERSGSKWVTLKIMINDIEKFLPQNRSGFIFRSIKYVAQNLKTS
jgi:hypothetical protein